MVHKIDTLDKSEVDLALFLSRIQYVVKLLTVIFIFSTSLCFPTRWFLFYWYRDDARVQ